MANELDPASAGRWKELAREARDPYSRDECERAFGHRAKSMAKSSSDSALVTWHHWNLIQLNVEAPPPGFFDPIRIVLQ